MLPACFPLTAAHAETLPSPRAGTVKISTVTEAITARFAATDDLLLMTPEKLAPRFKESEPDFFSGYTGARVIVDAARTRKAPAPAPVNGSAANPSPVSAGS